MQIVWVHQDSVSVSVFLAQKLHESMCTCTQPLQGKSEGAFSGQTVERVLPGLPEIKYSLWEFCPLFCNCVTPYQREQVVERLYKSQFVFHLPAPLSLLPLSTSLITHACTWSCLHSYRGTTSAAAAAAAAVVGVESDLWFKHQGADFLLNSSLHYFVCTVNLLKET
jgi:hypothetical protein